MVDGLGFAHHHWQRVEGRHRRAHLIMVGEDDVDGRVGRDRSRVHRGELEQDGSRAASHRRRCSVGVGRRALGCNH